MDRDQEPIGAFIQTKCRKIFRRHLPTLQLCNFPGPAQLRSRLQIFHLLTDITVGMAILDLDDMDSPGLTYRKQEKNECGNDSHGNQNALMNNGCC